jgi:hypothetical protein
MLGGGESLRLAAVFRSIVAPILLKIEGLASWSNEFCIQHVIRAATALFKLKQLPHSRSPLHKACLHCGGDELLAGTPPNFITTGIPADSEKFMNKKYPKFL